MLKQQLISYVISTQLNIFNYCPSVADIYNSTILVERDEECPEGYKFDGIAADGRKICRKK